MAQSSCAVGPVCAEDTVKAQRTPWGYLMGDRWLDLACIVISLIALFPIWPLWTQIGWLEALLALAGVYQGLGWLAAIGLISALGNYYIPSLSQTLVFILMAAVLLWRPAGLFGREEAL